VTGWCLRVRSARAGKTDPRFISHVFPETSPALGWRNVGKLGVPGRLRLDGAKGFEC
jgi:hypothetical protein